MARKKLAVKAKMAGGEVTVPEDNAARKEKAVREDKWQKRKSALTKDKIVIATLKCIVRYGYENTTMAKIAEIAQMSQGAMQYQFGTKIDAIKAAINFLHAKRLSDHQRALEEVPDGVDAMMHIVDFYWRQLNEDHFIAYQELVIAARTHPELASVLQPAYQHFVRVWRQNALSMVPQWRSDQFELISDIGQYLMEGLAYGRLNAQLNDERTAELLTFTRELLAKMVRDA